MVGLTGFTGVKFRQLVLMCQLTLGTNHRAESDGSCGPVNQMVSPSDGRLVPLPDQMVPNVRECSPSLTHTWLGVPSCGGGPKPGLRCRQFVFLPSPRCLNSSPSTGAVANYFLVVMRCLAVYQSDGEVGTAPGWVSVSPGAIGARCGCRRQLLTILCQFLCPTAVSEFEFFNRR